MEVKLNEIYNKTCWCHKILSVIGKCPLNGGPLNGGTTVNSDKRDSDFSNFITPQNQTQICMESVALITCDKFTSG